METRTAEETLSNKIVLVTGGSSGIGLGIAREFVRRGAKVIITGRDAPKLEQAVRDLGATAFAVTADVTKISEIGALYETIERDHGRLDVVVANAGGGESLALGLITEEHVDRTFDTNVKGVIFTVQGALPLMPNGGSVIIIGSNSSIHPPMGLSVYGAAKAAVRNLVRVWIQEIKGSGIRINVVSPGPVHTPALDAWFVANPALLPGLTAQSTVGRIGEAADVAHSVAFLASDAAGYINGIELFVDGGASQI